MWRDANMLVPDVQQPPADQDNDRGDPCPEDDEFFDGRRLVMAARMMVPEMKCELELYEYVLV